MVAGVCRRQRNDGVVHLRSQPQEALAVCGCVDGSRIFFPFIGFFIIIILFCPFLMSRRDYASWMMRDFYSAALYTHSLEK